MWIDCPWLANCVGRRNYKTFLVFVFTLITYALYMLGLALAKFIMFSKIDSDVQILFQSSPVRYPLSHPTPPFFFPLSNLISLAITWLP